MLNGTSISWIRYESKMWNQIFPFEVWKGRYWMLKWKKWFWMNCIGFCDDQIFIFFSKTRFYILFINFTLFSLFQSFSFLSRILSFDYCKKKRKERKTFKQILLFLSIVCSLTFQIFLLEMETEMFPRTYVLLLYTFVRSVKVTVEYICFVKFLRIHSSTWLETN